MFKSSSFYIVVSNKNIIIKKENSDMEKILSYEGHIPNVPFYHHFFDEGSSYLKDIRTIVKNLKIREARVIIPDDAIDIEVDKKVISEFFMVCGIKKVSMQPQFMFLSDADKKYISVSKTIRTMIVQYIVDNRVIARWYYDKAYADTDQLKINIRNLHADCEYENIPVYINNLNNDMEQFETIGKLVSVEEMLKNYDKNGGNK